MTTYLSEKDKALPMSEPPVLPAPDQDRVYVQRRLAAAVRPFGHCDLRKSRG